MVLSPTYERYREGNSSFERTLSLIQELLNERIGSEFRKISVQGSSRSRMFSFTIFFTKDRFNTKGNFYYGYTIRTQEVKNFRNWRPDGDLNSEIVEIEKLIELFRTNCLSDIIS